MQKRGILLAVLVVLVMFGLIGAYVFFSYGQLRPEDGKICEGIKVGEIDIGVRRPRKQPAGQRQKRRPGQLNPIHQGKLAR